MEADIAEALRRLRVTFNVSVESDENAKRVSMHDGVAPQGESKCRGEGDGAVVEFSPATRAAAAATAAAAAASMKVSKLAGLGSRGLSEHLVESSTVAAHINLCVS